jgi:hypothetical protein
MFIQFPVEKVKGRGRSRERTKKWTKKFQLQNMPLGTDDAAWSKGWRELNPRQRKMTEDRLLACVRAITSQTCSSTCLT